MKNSSSLVFHSPFSQLSLDQKEQQTVFLQFYLSELFSCMKAKKKSQPKDSSPFFWTKQACSFEKLKEHSSLLQHIFPSHAKTGREIENTFQKTEEKFSPSNAKNIFTLLFPLIEICKQTPTFIFFLLRHQKEISLLLSEESTKSFLERLCQEDVGKLSEKISQHYLLSGYKQISTKVQKLTKNLI